MGEGVVGDRLRMEGRGVVALAMLPGVSDLADKMTGADSEAVGLPIEGSDPAAGALLAFRPRVSSCSFSFSKSCMILNHSSLGIVMVSEEGSAEGCGEAEVELEEGRAPCISAGCAVF